MMFIVVLGVWILCYAWLSIDNYRDTKNPIKLLLDIVIIGLIATVLISFYKLGWRMRFGKSFNILLSGILFNWLIFILL